MKKLAASAVALAIAGSVILGSAPAKAVTFFDNTVGDFLVFGSLFNGILGSNQRQQQQPVIIQAPAPATATQPAQPTIVVVPSPQAAPASAVPQAAAAPQIIVVPQGGGGGGDSGGQGYTVAPSR